MSMLRDPTCRLVLLAAAVLAGCSAGKDGAPAPAAEPTLQIRPAKEGGGAPPGAERAFLQPSGTVQEIPEAHTVYRDYRLRPGDFLEVIYHVRHQRADAYRIKIQDVITVRFPFHPELNQTEQVQSDGALHLEIVGSIPVFDRTIGDVREELVRRYSRYLRDPELTVSFKQSNVKIAELKQAIQTAPRGQSRLVPIAPDGRISLPFIADVQAAGQRIGELHRDLNRAYQDAGLSELEVTVNLQTIAPVRVYVLGEVRRAGLLPGRTGTPAAAGRVSLLQALAQAGGPLPPRAELSRVMLIRRKDLPRPQAAIVNVRQLLENRTRTAGANAPGDRPVVADDAAHRFDIWLQDGDVVYVPTTEIARRADYIEYVWTRGIRAVGGFSSQAYVGYTAGENVDWLGGSP